MVETVAKKQKSPAVLNHYEVPEILPGKILKYCNKKITGPTYVPRLQQN